VDSALLALLPSTVSVQSLTGVSTDGYATPTYSTATNYYARVADVQRMVRTFNGDEQISRTVVWLYSTGSFDPSDKVTLPDGSTPPLIATERWPDQDGDYYTKLWFGE
jgi:hypothetical protein